MENINKNKFMEESKVATKVSDYLDEFETAEATFRFADVSSKRSKYNKDIELLVKRSSDQRKLKLEGDLALHTRLENINAGNIEINTDDMTFSNKEKNVTITLKNGQT